MGSRFYGDADRWKTGYSFFFAVARWSCYSLLPVGAGCVVKRDAFHWKDIWQKHQANDRFVLIGIDRDEPVIRLLHLEGGGVTLHPLGPGSRCGYFAKYALGNRALRVTCTDWPRRRIVKLTRLYEGWVCFAGCSLDAMPTAKVSLAEVIVMFSADWWQFCLKAKFGAYRLSVSKVDVQPVERITLDDSLYCITEVYFTAVIAGHGSMT